MADGFSFMPRLNVTESQIRKNIEPALPVLRQLKWVYYAVGVSHRYRWRFARVGKVNLTVVARIVQYLCLNFSPIFVYELLGKDITDNA